MSSPQFNAPPPRRRPQPQQENGKSQVDSPSQAADPPNGDTPREVAKNKLAMFNIFMEHHLKVIWKVKGINVSGSTISSVWLMYFKLANDYCYVCWAQTRLAEKIGCSKEQVQKATTWLKDNGYLKLINAAKPGSKATNYKVALPRLNTEAVERGV